ncbi:hypothetical protein Dsin_014140 [Dipteronia sinensis]|uniref:Uncharacterized protein n=1 Tax=Dipteronia sinensis TaxID=43782 RepID=A0AAE0AM98_9ROSI|nr:hypothetical protein Dsin_014140 [Dipteronia sinensis]
MNLDPLDMYPDHEIWEVSKLTAIFSHVYKKLYYCILIFIFFQALEKFQLKTIVSCLPKLPNSSAHRVPTVTDSDMVMVLSYGELVEYDVPSKLMETNSAFSKLLDEYRYNYGRNSIQS